MGREIGGVTAGPRALRVLEDSSGVAAAYCAKLLAEAGFDVVRGPSALEPDLDLYLNARKRQVPSGKSGGLATLADIVVTDAAAGFEDSHGLLVRITPYGATGPYADLPATELIVEAMGGLLYMVGKPEREPVKPYGYQAAYLTGASAAVAVLGAVVGGRWAGERIDISEMETVAALIENAIILPQYTGAIRGRWGSQLPESGPCTDIYATLDGAVSLAAQIHPQWEALAAWMGRLDLLEDERFRDFAAHKRHPEALATILRDWFQARTTSEAFAEGQEYRIPIAPVHSLAGLLADPHLYAAGAWESVEGDDVVLPCLPWRVDGATPAGAAAPPRCAGSEEVMSGWPARGAVQAADPAASHDGPLAGLRVIDLSVAWAGPLCAGLLADLGAEVIKVEAAVRPDGIRFSTRHASAPVEPWNAGGWFHLINRNKRGIALDLRTPRGRELLVDLVRQADVLVENYSRRVMENFGLPYGVLAEANPDLVMISMPGFGDVGPYRDYVAFGEIIESVAGLSSLTGYRDGLPMRAAIAYGDPVSGLHGAVAVLAELMRRPERGRGAHIVFSHMQGTARFLGEAIVAHQRGRPPGRMGSRDDTFVPQGVFPCRGVDRWIALSVRSDAEWRALAATLGATIDRPEFSTAAGRHAHEDAIERAISAATAGRDRDGLVSELRSVGLAAAPVNDAADLLRDAHLQARAFFSEVDQPGVGRVTMPGAFWHFERDPLRVRFPAPRLGEHTDDVLARVLGLAEGDIAGLRASGVTSADVPYVWSIGV